MNVFHLPDVPRLSVDIDLMVTGAPDASPRSPVRQGIIEAVRRVARAQDYQVEVVDTHTSGCKLYLRYRNSLGTWDQVKIDLDFLNRATLAPAVALAGPQVFDAGDLLVTTVSRAELFGSKLTTVAYRHHERDLYDMYRMLALDWHKQDRARALYLGYLFLQDHELYRLGYPMRLEVSYDREKLRDVLRESEDAPRLEDVRARARDTLGGAPDYGQLQQDEKAFHEKLLQGDVTAFGGFCGEEDPARRTGLERHPGLLWRLKQLDSRQT